MFPDSKLAKNFSLARTKCLYMQTYGIFPYLFSVLMDEIKFSDYCSISFDESMNKITQNEQMDIDIRFWNKLTNLVESRYLKSVFLGHTAASDLLNAFKSGLTDINMDNISQVSMDGPSVNWKFYDDITRDRDQFELSGLINIGSCGLHVIHGMFKAGIEAVGWDLKKLLKGLFQLFHDSAARWSD